MKKRTLLVAACLLFAAILTFSIPTFAATDSDPSAPALKIARNSVELKNSIYMNFKVQVTNIDNTENVQLLVWESAPVEWQKDTANVTLSAAYTESSTGYLVFQYTDLAAKDMTKTVYVCAYANVNGEDVYSKPTKLSIVQYAYNALTSSSTSDNLKDLLNNMLDYGASAQIYFGHNTDFLATDPIAKVKVVNGTHADGFSTGYYKAGTSVTLTANAPEDGYVFSHWENSAGQLVGTESSLTIDECVTETYTAMYRNAASAVQYRYRDKQYTTSQTLLAEPWVLYDTTITYTHSGYNYMYLRRSLGGTDYGYSYDDILLYKADNSEKYCFHGSPIEMYQYVRKYVSAGPEYIYLTYSETEDVDLTKYNFYQNCWALKYCTAKTEQKTYHYYQWSEWSEWSDTPITATDDKEVEVRGIFTVSYDANGGENAPTTQVKAMGESIVISADIPTREGYTFEGWSSTSDGTVEYGSGDTYTVDSSITLYAVWDANTYTIAYNANGGENAPEAQTKTYGIDIALSNSVPTRDGYTFQGWATSANGEMIYHAGDIYATNGDLSLYAMWSINTYTITYNANGGENAPDVQTKTYGIDMVLSNSVPIREGYTFEGWATSANGEIVYRVGDIYTANVDLILYAVWNIKTCTIIYDANGGENAPKPQTKTYGIDIALSNSVPTREGYSFEGWAMSANGEVIYHAGDIYTTNGDLNLYAIWSINTYTITYNANGGENAPESQMKTYGIDLVLSNAVPTREGYIFQGWATSADSEVVYNAGDIYTANKELGLYARWYEYWGSVGLNFTSNGDGTCSVSSIGTCTDQHLVIPHVSLSGDLVTNINTYAFKDCSTIISVTIPNEVVANIGYRAFYNCGNLSHVVVGDGVTTIGNEAFSNCEKLNSVVLGSGITDIKYRAFFCCSSLTNITIPNGVKNIGEEAFYKCINITSISIPNTVTNISANTFYNCTNLTTVSFGNSITSIGDNAFYNCTKLIDVSIGNSVVSIGNGAFYACAIENINIPNSVTNIGENAFYNCTNLVNLSIGDGVTSISDGAFYNCTSLANISMGKSIVNIGNNTFYNCAIENISLPESVTSIGEFAFYSCSNLTSITIPNNVTYINRASFAYCSNLTEVIIGNGVTTIEQNAFCECKSLTKIFIPNNVQSIGKHAFVYCENLTDISLGSGLIIIDDYAFAQCINLTNITIPNSVVSIGVRVFQNCSKLDSVIFENPNGWIANNQSLSGLSDASIAAQRLTTKYNYYAWTKE